MDSGAWRTRRRLATRAGAEAVGGRDRCGWQGRQDLNLQPSALETDALPLSYSPNDLGRIAGARVGKIRVSRAVETEADVYINRPRRARGEQKNRPVPPRLGIPALRERDPRNGQRPECRAWSRVSGGAPSLRWGGACESPSENREGLCESPSENQTVIFVTTPAPTVRPPSRIANRSPSSHAILVISSTSTLMLSPGITISIPAGSCTMPVTSVVRK
jgi:hypothetical protein